MWSLHIVLVVKGVNVKLRTKDLGWGMAMCDMYKGGSRRYTM